MVIVLVELGNMATTIYFPEDDKTFKRGFIVLGLEFIFIGIGFIIYGVLTMRTLKKHFSSFYMENFTYLIGATLCLSVPLMIRGILNLLNGVWPDFHQTAMEYL